jgi:ELWxxDGT repeat protein
LADLVPGSAGSDPGSFVFAGPNLFFTATTPATGRELYVWTGGSAAPVLVADLTSGSGSTFQTALDGNDTWRAPYGNHAVFFAHDPSATTEFGPGRMLLATTTQAVVLAANQTIPNGALPVPRTRLGVTANGRFFFVGTDGTGYEPWVSDGTAAGTRELADLATSGVEGSSSSSSLPYSLTALGNAVYFCTTFGNPSGKKNIWRSDGTTVTTAIQFNQSNADGYGPFEMDAVNGHLLFARINIGTTAIRGTRFFRSDGTQAGTTIINTQFTMTHPNDSRSISNLTVTGGRLHLMGGTTTTGAEWWSTDGTTFTAQGEILPGAASVLALNSDRVALSGLPNGRGVLGILNGVAALWGSNGGAVSQLVQVDSGPANGRIEGVTPAAGGGVVFGAVSADGVGRVWASDGTAAGTRIVSAPPAPVSYLGVDNIIQRPGALIGGQTWFARRDHPQPAGSGYTPIGDEPFTLAGGQSGAQATLVADVRPGTGANSYGTIGLDSISGEFTGIGGTVFFRAQHALTLKNPS